MLIRIKELDLEQKVTGVIIASEDFINKLKSQNVSLGVASGATHDVNAKNAISKSDVYWGKRERRAC